MNYYFMHKLSIEITKYEFCMESEQIPESYSNIFFEHPLPWGMLMDRIMQKIESQKWQTRKKSDFDGKAKIFTKLIKLARRTNSEEWGVLATPQWRRMQCNTEFGHFAKPSGIKKRRWKTAPLNNHKIVIINNLYRCFRVKDVHFF